MPRRKRGPVKKVGIYQSKRKTVDGTHVFKGAKSGLFMAPKVGKKRKRYIAKKYRKNVLYGKW